MIGRRLSNQPEPPAHKRARAPPRRRVRSGSFPLQEFLAWPPPSRTQCENSRALRVQPSMRFKPRWQVLVGGGEPANNRLARGLADERVPARRGTRRRRHHRSLTHARLPPIRSCAQRAALLVARSRAAPRPTDRRHRDINAMLGAWRSRWPADALWRHRHPAAALRRRSLPPTTLPNHTKSGADQVRRNASAGWAAWTTSFARIGKGAGDAATADFGGFGRIDVKALVRSDRASATGTVADVFGSVGKTNRSDAIEAVHPHVLSEGSPGGTGPSGPTQSAVGTCFTAATETSSPGAVAAVFGGVPGPGSKTFSGTAAKLTPNHESAPAKLDVATSPITTLLVLSLAAEPQLGSKAGTSRGVARHGVGTGAEAADDGLLDSPQLPLHRSDPFADSRQLMLGQSLVRQPGEDLAGGGTVYADGAAAGWEATPASRMGWRAVWLRRKAERAKSSEAVGRPSPEGAETSTGKCAKAHCDPKRQRPRRKNLQGLTVSSAHAGCGCTGAQAGRAQR
eukprot:CAMPEP_0170279734 /NCGR_PEP_ID=MMETSP0116_2-20130129/39879_1 /TAXON_ID=400756 /ORGANISM="Durinskia baltica, Strain CSIRO CS-38" /LENGTH=510 /DNA_ID=CAMNT_0010531061 /DNA_START=60 /DNA_END=1588 /DNA_ORIENTATION=+